MGHPHLFVGTSSMAISPSPSFMPGQLPFLTCSDICKSSALAAGNVITAYRTTAPLSGVDAFDSWHTSRMQNLPIPRPARSAVRMGFAAPPFCAMWKKCTVSSSRRKSDVSTPSLKMKLSNSGSLSISVTPILVSCQILLASRTNSYSSDPRVRKTPAAKRS